MSKLSEQDRFARDVRERHGTSENLYITETILEFCVEKGIDPSSLDKVVNRSLKMQIKKEAIERNLLKKPKPTKKRKKK